MDLTLSRHSVPAIGCVLLFCLATSARGDIETLTLYQKAARAPLVARVRALSDSTRRPAMKVLEVLKGEYENEELTVVPHFRDRYRPTPWLEREVFREGEESILFLQPYVDDFGRAGDPDTFSLLNADQGKLPIPAEGSAALLDALRRIFAIQAIESYDDKIRAFRELLGEDNPFLVESGLEQCARFHLATITDSETLLDLAKAPRPDFRSGAMALLGQIVSDGLVRDPRATFPPVLFETIASAAQMDEAEEVRLSAVEALAAYRTTAALRIIESIGVNDASQDVRYLAQIMAHRLREQPTD